MGAKRSPRSRSTAPGVSQCHQRRRRQFYARSIKKGRRRFTARIRHAGSLMWHLKSTASRPSRSDAHGNQSTGTSRLSPGQQLEQLAKGLVRALVQEQAGKPPPRPNVVA